MTEKQYVLFLTLTHPKGPKTILNMYYIVLLTRAPFKYGRLYSILIGQISPNKCPITLKGAHFYTLLSFKVILVEKLV